MLNKAVSCTDVGIRKEVNQDSLHVAVANTGYGSMVLAVICDGLGGYSMGEVASSKTVTIFKEWFQHDMPLILEKGFSWDIVEQHWKNLIFQANVYIKKMSETQNVKMGTTLSAGLFFQNQYLLAQVGDTRCYEIAQSTIRQLTQDQTLVAREVQMGLLTQEQALVDPRKHILMQCIGCQDSVEAEYIRGVVHENSNYVFCTDGFYKRLTDMEVKQYLCYYAEQNKESIESNIKKMIETVKNRGEQDNISCIVLYI